MERCNKSTAAKYCTDLMHGMFSNEYMASRSTMGGSSSRNEQTKPSLPREKVLAIIGKYTVHQLSAALVMFVIQRSSYSIFMVHKCTYMKKIGFEL